MGEKLPVIAFAGKSPGRQLLAAFICVLLVFIVVYPLFLLIGWLAGVDLNALSDAASGLVASPGSLKYLQLAQHISLFILPVLTWSYISGGGITGFSGLNILPRVEHITLVVLISLLLFPVNSYTTFMNSEMELPEWLRGMETWMLAKEKQGEYLTAFLIVSDTIGVLIINLLVLAIVPAIGEELFFRGVIQRQLRLIIGLPNLTVFITAVIFSALHLQFYGFLPRFILGLVYGYLFLWSGSVWLPVIAHFINNAVPVILTYFYGWEKVSDGSLERVAERPIFPAISLIAVILLMTYASKALKRQPASHPA